MLSFINDNSLPQGSILAPVLSDIFVDGMDSGIEYIHGKFGNDTKLGSVVDTLEGRDASHSDL